MAKSRSLQQAVRFALATATAAAGVSALHAQEAPAPAPTAAPVEEVVVTGSRLQTPNETAISPITTVSSVDLQQTGLTRVEDVLNNLPMVFAGMNSTTSNGNDGTATVDLRGLGNQRTLVLVDGLRLGPGSASGGRNFSDINQVPAALIERVDVLTGGASAVYGADAVAGVVNFILNTHFEGVRVDAGYHFNEHSNSNQDGVNSIIAADQFPVPTGRTDTAFGKNGSILMGSNFADNKGNATAYTSPMTTRPGATEPVRLQRLHAQWQQHLRPDQAGLRRLLDLCEERRWRPIPCLLHQQQQHPQQYRRWRQGRSVPAVQEPQDLFNYGPLNFYQTPNERWTGGGFANYDINSHVNVYASVMFMSNASRRRSPRAATSATAISRLADPLLNASEQAVFCNKRLAGSAGQPG